MDQVRNYQKELDRIIEKQQNEGEIPTLLLHSCCAPCSSYCLEYLRQFFRITVFYYNPNISMEDEYRKRVQEQIRLIEAFNQQVDGYPIAYIEGDYDTESFYQTVKGLENCKEGGERCFRCYRLRLEKTMELAEVQHFDYCTTTLTISPLKNAQKINEIGEELAKGCTTKWLPSDFKKKNGYKRSVELSSQYQLYRQDFCGCIYSKMERERCKMQQL